MKSINITHFSSNINSNSLCYIFFMPQKLTINVYSYCSTLIKLRQGIRNKLRNLPSDDIWLFHDNIKPRRASQIQDLITSFSWEKFDHHIVRTLHPFCWVSPQAPNSIKRVCKTKL